jgi:signal transduction histidine kinase
MVTSESSFTGWSEMRDERQTLPHGIPQSDCALDDAAVHTISDEANDLMRLCLILLDSALKYTLPCGTVSASVSRARGTVALQIRDTGIGISEHDLPNICRPSMMLLPSAIHDGDSH